MPVMDKKKKSQVSKTLDIYESKNALKSCQWFLSVPDCETLYILATYENKKGKFIFRCAKNGKSLKEEKHICPEYFIQLTYIYYPFVISTASLNHLNVLNVYNVQTTRITSTQLPQDITIIGLFAYSFAISILCTDRIIRIPHLDDLKKNVTVIMLNDFKLSTQCKVIDRNNKIYIEICSGSTPDNKEVVTEIMDLATGKIISPYSFWKLYCLSRHTDFSERIYCTLNKTTFYLYVKEQNTEYRISNATSFCVITGAINQKIAIGAADGTISLYSNHFKSLTIIGTFELAPLLEEKTELKKNLEVLKIFPVQADFIVSIHPDCVAIWNTSTFCNISVIELKNQAADYSLIDLNLFLLFHIPKKHIMWLNLEDTIKKTEKLPVTNFPSSTRPRVSSHETKTIVPRATQIKLVRRHSIEVIKNVIISNDDSSSSEELIVQTKPTRRYRNSDESFKNSEVSEKSSENEKKNKLSKDKTEKLKDKYNEGVVVDRLPTSDKSGSDKSGERSEQEKGRVSPTLVIRKKSINKSTIEDEKYEKSENSKLDKKSEENIKDKRRKSSTWSRSDKEYKKDKESNFVKTSFQTKRSSSLSPTTSAAELDDTIKIDLTDSEGMSFLNDLGALGSPVQSSKDKKTSPRPQRRNSNQSPLKRTFSFGEKKLSFRLEPEEINVNYGSIHVSRSLPSIRIDDPLEDRIDTDEKEENLEGKK